MSRLFRMFRTNSKKGQSAAETDVTETVPGFTVPDTQTVLLLRAPRQAYKLVPDYPIPDLNSDAEVLVKTQSVGLNPIDWKAPDFGFGIPELPYIAGRELSGEVVRTGKDVSEWRLGDRVVAISTDYRDLRKGAYQEYVVAHSSNLVKLPPNTSFDEGATLGVAYVAAILGLGVSLGLNFSHILDGPDLFRLVRDVKSADIPADVAPECLDSIGEDERLQPGDWLVIWGGSGTSANLLLQLAKLAGVKTIAVVDSAKHGHRLTSHQILQPDLLVDSHDPERAFEIIQKTTKGQARFGIDTRGKDTATHLLHALSPTYRHVSENRRSNPPSPPGTPQEGLTGRSHLVGLSGLPKDPTHTDVTLHTVPIKLFHEVPVIGRTLCQWLERLLRDGLLHPPDIVGFEDGLENVNNGLDRMRKGEISGGKLVVRLP